MPKNKILAAIPRSIRTIIFLNNRMFSKMPSVKYPKINQSTTDNKEIKTTSEKTKAELDSTILKGTNSTNANIYVKNKKNLSNIKQCRKLPEVKIQNNSIKNEGKKLLTVSAAIPPCPELDCDEKFVNKTEEDGTNILKRAACDIISSTDSVKRNNSEYSKLYESKQALADRIIDDKSSANKNAGGNGVNNSGGQRGDGSSEGGSDSLAYKEYSRQKELLSQSTCSADTLYKYLYNIDPDKAINFVKTGYWPADIQIPKSLSVLNSTWGIDWSQVPGGGYVLDVNGNPIKSEYIPQINDILDRYGPPTGTYTSPVKNGIPYNYNERSLPYVEDKSLYHQYKVKGDFTNIKYYIDNCKNPELKAQVEAAILKYHGGNYDGLKTYIGDIAPGFGSLKGGTQVQLPLTVEQLKGLGLIEEL